MFGFYKHIFNFKMDKNVWNLYYINVYVNEFYPGIPRTKSRSVSYHLTDCSNNLISINGLGIKEEMFSCWNIRPNGNKDYLILFFYDEVDFYLKNKRVDNTKNRWIILTPGTKHSYGCNNRSWNHSWLHLSGVYVDKILGEGRIPLNQFLDIGGPEIFEELLLKIHEEIYYNSVPEMKIISNDLDSCFIKVNRELEKRSSKHIPKEFLFIKQKLDISYTESHSMEMLAGSVKLSVPYFCKRFKHFFYESPIDYLINKRIEISKYFLENTDLQISEISEKVGYDDFYYFSKLFKKRVGVSPSRFRAVSS